MEASWRRLSHEKVAWLRLEDFVLGDIASQVDLIFIRRLRYSTDGAEYFSTYYLQWSIFGPAKNFTKLKSFNRATRTPLHNDVEHHG